MSVMNSNVAQWSALLLNVCDLSRFAPSQKDQVGCGSAVVKGDFGAVELWVWLD